MGIKGLTNKGEKTAKGIRPSG